MKNLLILIIIAGLAYGGYYYLVHKADVTTLTNDINNAKTTVVTTTNTGIDSAITSIFKSIANVAPIYYVQNRNYGISSSQNICNDTTNAGSIGNVIAQIQKYTQAVSCVPASDFPSRSFTITAESKVTSGQYFCADQTGFVGLIPSISSGNFNPGVKCK